MIKKLLSLLVVSALGLSLATPSSYAYIGGEEFDKIEKERKEEYENRYTNTDYIDPALKGTGAYESIKERREQEKNGNNAQNWQGSVAPMPNNPDPIVPNTIVNNTPTAQEIINFLYEKGATIFNTKDKFMFDSNITREQASKFFVMIKKTVFPEKNVSKAPGTSCSFTDLKKADKTLQSFIVEACEMWLFKGHAGKFMPFDKLTYGQAITVLMRIINNWPMDETQGAYYTNYFKKATSLGITTKFDEANANANVTRGTVGKWFHIANQLKELKKI